VNDYHPDQLGMTEFLNSDMLADAVRAVAEIIRLRAMLMSPIGDPKDDPHAGRYMASWEVHVDRFSGATGDRVQATVRNFSPEAFWVEYGHRGREPYYVLRRAATEVRWS
jgi:hypothetical protein